MNNGFGSELPSAHRLKTLRPQARYLVLIDSGGFMVARLFSAERVQLIEFDGSTEEATQMMAGGHASQTANDPVWDAVLRGHSTHERALAQVFELAL
jgi:hypothetical protein